MLIFQLKKELRLMRNLRILFLHTGKHIITSLDKSAVNKIFNVKNRLENIINASLYSRWVAVKDN